MKNIRIIAICFLLLFTLPLTCFADNRPLFPIGAELLYKYISQDVQNCTVGELEKNPATDSYDFYVYKSPGYMRLNVNLAYNADGYVTAISIGSSHITNEYATFTMGICAVALSQIGLTHDEIQFLAHNISEFSRTPQEICYASTVHSSAMQHSIALLIDHETNGELLVFIVRDPNDKYI